MLPLKPPHSRCSLLLTNTQSMLLVGPLKVGLSAILVLMTRPAAAATAVAAATAETNTPSTTSLLLPHTHIPNPTHTYILIPTLP